MNIKSEFEKRINKLSGRVVDRTSLLETSVGQRYQLAINKVVWYAVHIFIEVDGRICDKQLFTRPINLIFGVDHNVYEKKLSEHGTLSGALKKLKSIQACLTRLDRSPVLPDELGQTFKIIIKNGRDAVMNPDKYFVPGDHVLVNKFLYYHAGIYIGDERVIHVVDPLDKNSISQAQVQETEWSVFHSNICTFEIVIPLIQRRSNELVIGLAKSMVGRLKGEYNLLKKNCQHFASNCQTGHARSEDVEIVEEIGGAVAGATVASSTFGAVGLITSVGSVTAIPALFIATVGALTGRALVKALRNNKKNKKLI